jgi:hypothetical protein
MPTNPYFNSYTASNEQNLLEGMIIESIQMKGLDCVYITRDQENMDYLYNEDPTSLFTEQNYIEMYPASIDGFEGEINFGRYELEFNQSCTFIVSKKRFADTFADILKPREGDLIFMPITKAFLEIKFVNNESPFFIKGKQYVWEVKCELYKHSHEQFTVTDQETEDALAAMDIERFIEDDFEDFDGLTEDQFSDNTDLQVDADDLIISNPNNPFGVK